MWKSVDILTIWRAPMTLGFCLTAGGTAIIENGNKTNNAEEDKRAVKPYVSLEE